MYKCIHVHAYVKSYVFVPAVYNMPPFCRLETAAGWRAHHSDGLPFAPRLGQWLPQGPLPCLCVSSKGES